MEEDTTLTESYNPLHWDLLANELAFRGDFRGAVNANARALELTPDRYFDLEKRANLFGLVGETDIARKDLDRLCKIPDDPRFRLANTESSIKYQEGDLPSSVGVVETFAKDGLRLYAAGTLLRAGDPILDPLS